MSSGNDNPKQPDSKAYEGADPLSDPLQRSTPSALPSMITEPSAVLTTNTRRPATTTTTTSSSSSMTSSPLTTKRAVRPTTQSQSRIPNTTTVPGTETETTKDTDTAVRTFAPTATAEPPTARTTTATTTSTSNTNNTNNNHDKTKHNQPSQTKRLAQPRSQPSSSSSLSTGPTNTITQATDTHTSLASPQQPSHRPVGTLRPTVTSPLTSKTRFTTTSPPSPAAGTTNITTTTTTTPTRRPPLKVSAHNTMHPTTGAATTTTTTTNASTINPSLTAITATSSSLPTSLPLTTTIASSTTVVRTASDPALWKQAAQPTTTNQDRARQAAERNRSQQSVMKMSADPSSDNSATAATATHHSPPEPETQTSTYANASLSRDMGVSVPRATQPPHTAPVIDPIGVGVPLVSAPQEPAPSGGNDSAGGGAGEAWAAFVVEEDDTKIATAVAVDESGSRKKFLYIGIAVLVVVIAAVVGVVVAVSGGGDEGSNNLSTPAPQAPTPPPPLPCFGSLRDLASEMATRREDTSVFAEYELCPGTEFRVDNPVNRAQPYQGNQPPLLAQSNMRVRCGSDGSLLNECILRNGETLALSSAATAGVTSIGAASTEGTAANTNVIFEGITFFQVDSTTLIEMSTGGSVTFRNCAFTSRTDLFTQTMLKIDAVSNSLNVTFDGCIFEELKFGARTADTSRGFTSLVVTGSSANTVKFKDCVFRNNINDDGPTYAGGVISSIGAAINIEKSCFILNNIVGNLKASQAATVLLAGDATSSSFSGLDVSVEISPVQQFGQGCALAAQFATSGAVCVAEPDTTDCSSTRKDIAIDWLRN